MKDKPQILSKETKIILFNFAIIFIAALIALSNPNNDLNRCSTIPIIDTSIAGMIGRWAGIVVLIFSIANVYFVWKWWRNG